MKKVTLILPVFLALVSTVGKADILDGFVPSVECDARSLRGGHPADATKMLLGTWKNDASGQKAFYVLSHGAMRVGLTTTQIRPDSLGSLKADLLAMDLDNGQNMLYGNLNIQFDSNGTGKGIMESAFETKEQPSYVFGSLELSNCRVN
ncbi:MAG: hypothetical protein ACXWQO_11995 [Bdellovibrionota bacterium]